MNHVKKDEKGLWFILRNIHYFHPGDYEVLNREALAAASLSGGSFGGHDTAVPSVPSFSKGLRV